MNARKALPFMRLFSADYRRDTRHLTTEQHGAYLLILMAYWEQQGPLPEAHIERATELSPRAWQAHRDTLAEFFTVKAGVWTSRKYDKDVQQAAETSRRRTTAGRAGGAERGRRRRELPDYTPRHRQNTPALKEWRELRLQAFERDGYVCTYCGTPTDEPHCDHVVPVIRGGSSKLDNLTTACAACNLSKGSKLVSEWRADQ